LSSSLAQYRDSGGFRIGDILRVGGGHGKELHLAIYPFFIGLL
jgi:hypothetical protein